MVVDRRFGLWSATFLVIANMVGTGIYTTTGFIALDLPSELGILGLWILGGLAAYGGAMAYAFLAQRYPRSGGEYHFLSQLYHPIVGYAAGLVSLVVGFAAPVAASAYAFASYLPLGLSEGSRQLAAVGLILALALVHLLGLGRAARIQNAFVLIKIFLLVSLILGGLSKGNWSAPGLWSCPARSLESAKAAALGLIFISYAYSGWNAAAYITSEVPHATRIVPLAIMIGTLVVGGLYVLFHVALFFHFSAGDLARFAAGGDIAVGRLLAERLWGPAGKQILGWGISLAMVSSVSAMLMIAPRVLSVMGEDYPFFGFFSQRNRYQAPTWAILTVGLLAVAIVWSAAFDAIVAYIGFTLSIWAALTVAGAYLRHGRERRLSWFDGILFLLLSAWMIGNNLVARWIESLIGLGTIGLLALSYFWVRSWKGAGKSIS